MKYSKTYFLLNVLFVFIFLNVWDFVINGIFFNGMLLGLIMFAPIGLLWFIGKFKAVVLITLISIFEFVVMSIFVWEGFELSGASSSVKSIFWMPYLAAAVLNGFWGLKIYSDKKERNVRSS